MPNDDGELSNVVRLVSDPVHSILALMCSDYRHAAIVAIWISKYNTMSGDLGLKQDRTRTENTRNTISYAY